MSLCPKTALNIKHITACDTHPASWKLLAWNIQTPSNTIFIVWNCHLTLLNCSFFLFPSWYFFDASAMVLFWLLSFLNPPFYDGSAMPSIALWNFYYWYCKSFSWKFVFLKRSLFFSPLICTFTHAFVCEYPISDWSLCVV